MAEPRDVGFFAALLHSVISEHSSEWGIGIKEIATHTDLFQDLDFDSIDILEFRSKVNQKLPPPNQWDDSANSEIFKLRHITIGRIAEILARAEAART